MRKFLKMWSLPRTGSNYLRYVLESNFNVRVFMQRLSFKHGPPTTDLSVKRADWIPEEWDETDSLFMGPHAGFMKTVKPLVPAGQANIQKAIDEERINHLLCVRDPYAWAVRICVEKAPGIAKTGDDKLALLIKRWRVRAQQYLDFVDQHNDKAMLIRTEDCLEGQPGIAAIADRFNLERLTKGPLSYTRQRVLATGDNPPATSKRTFRPAYYTDREYLGEITPHQYAVINKSLRNKQLHALGYARRSGPLKIQFPSIRHAKDPGDWWTLNLTPHTVPIFVEMMSKPDHKERRQALIELIKRDGIKSVLDCGGGPGLNGALIKTECPDVSYRLVDSAQVFVDYAEQRGFKAEMGDVQDLPFGDSSFDLTACKDLLEHLPGFEKALGEMIRVASRRVHIIFFRPLGKTTKRTKDRHGVLYNTYGKDEVKRFLSRNPKVKSWRFQGRYAMEIILRENQSVHGEDGAPEEAGRISGGESSESVPGSGGAGDLSGVQSAGEHACPGCAPGACGAAVAGAGQPDQNTAPGDEEEQPEACCTESLDSQGSPGGRAEVRAAQHPSGEAG